MNRLRYSAIACVLSVCFDDAIHGRCASYLVNILLKIKLLRAIFTKMKHIFHVLHHQNKWTMFTKHEEAGFKLYLTRWVRCLRTKSKHISHVLHHQNKWTIHMGWHCTIVCESQNCIATQLLLEMTVTWIFSTWGPVLKNPATRPIQIKIYLFYPIYNLI